MIENTILLDKVEELLTLDKSFDNLKNDYIIKQEFLILNEFLEKRTAIIEEIKDIISKEANLDIQSKNKIESDIRESTLIATSKCKSIQQELKSRLISSNKHKQAFQYFNNTPVKPTFIDKTV